MGLLTNLGYMGLLTSLGSMGLLTNLGYMCLLTSLDDLLCVLFSHSLHADSAIEHARAKYKAAFMSFLVGWETDLFAVELCYQLIAAALFYVQKDATSTLAQALALLRG